MERYEERRKITKQYSRWSEEFILIRIRELQQYYYAREETKNFVEGYAE